MVVCPDCLESFPQRQALNGHRLNGCQKSNIQQPTFCFDSSRGILYDGQNYHFYALIGSSFSNQAFASLKPAMNGSAVFIANENVTTLGYSFKFPLAGGTGTYQINNNTGSRLGFKVKTTDNTLIGVSDVYFHVDDGYFHNLVVTRHGGHAKHDKLVIEWKRLGVEQDICVAFQDQIFDGAFTIPIICD